MEKHTVKVEGMKCEGCAKKVRESLESRREKMLRSTWKRKRLNTSGMKRSMV